MMRCLRILVFLAAVLGVGIFVLNIHPSAELKQAIAATDALDGGWRFGGIEATRAKVADADNAALVIELGERLIKRDEGWFDQHACLDSITLSPAQRLTTAQVAAIREVLAKQAPAMAEFRKVCHMPRGRYALPISDDPTKILPANLSTRRVALVALRYDLYERLEANDPAGASEKLVGCFNAGHAIHDEPFPISYLIRVAVDSMTLSGCERFLALCEADDATLAKVQAELEKLESEPTFYWAMRGERGWAFSAFDFYKIQPSQFAAFGTDATLLRGFLPFVPGVLERAQAALLRHSNLLVELARTPQETWDSQLDAIHRSEKNLPILADESLATLSKMIPIAQRQTALIRCMIVAVAAERYRVKHGKWPEKLSELVTEKLLRDVPVDPFGGKSLRWQRTADGAVVYSVHLDGVDNDGDLGRGKPVFERKDVGYELFDPAKRRQAPPG